MKQYEKLMADPEWVAKYWTPHVGKEHREKRQPCGCGHTRDVVRARGGVWTCMACLARDHVNDSSRRTCGVPATVNIWAKALDGICRDWQYGMYKESKQRRWVESGI